MTNEEIKKILDGAPDDMACYNPPTRNYLPRRCLHNLSDLRTIIELSERVQELEAESESLSHKVTILQDKLGEPVDYKCVVYDLNCANAKIKETLIRMGWVPPKEKDDD